MKSSQNRHLCKPICIILSLVSLIVSGIVWLSLTPWIFDYIIQSAFILKPNSMVFDIWKKNPFPMALDLYLFNWTNPEDINKPNVKPRFQQMGPYRFMETKEKVNISWNSNDTVTFRHLRNWYYDTKNSGGSLSDRITTINPIAMTAAHQVRDWPDLIKGGFSLTLSTMLSGIDITKPAGEWLFDGYDDPFIDIARNLPFLAGVEIPPVDKFGWFYGRNGSMEFDGVLNMATGVNNDIGRLFTWNYNEQTPYYESICGKVHGSAGEFFPANRKRDFLEFFSPDMCRYVALDYSEDVKVRDIMGYKYSSGRRLLDNGSLIPENECYCNGECVPSGMLNLTSCRYGTPAFVSLPHYCDADPVYINSVDGLVPIRDKHEFFITLEPRTGVPLDVAARLQVNLLVYPIENINLFEEVPRVFFPILWFEQRVTISEDLASSLRLLLHIPAIFTGISVALIVLGLALTILLAYYSIRKLLNTKIVTVHEHYNNEDVPLRGKYAEKSVRKFKQKT